MVWYDYTYICFVGNKISEIYIYTVLLGRAIEICYLIEIEDLFLTIKF